MINLWIPFHARGAGLCGNLASITPSDVLDARPYTGPQSERGSQDRRLKAKRHEKRMGEGVTVTAKHQDSHSSRIQMLLADKKFLKATDLSKNASKYVRATLCPECSFVDYDYGECLDGRTCDPKRHYCRLLSRHAREYVCLYNPIYTVAKSEDLTFFRITQAIAQTPDASESQIWRDIGGDKRKVRDCLSGLVAISFLQCVEKMEKGNMTRRYNLGTNASIRSGFIFPVVIIVKNLTF